MKPFTHSSILLEVSERELELIMTAALTTKLKWIEEAGNTLRDEDFQGVYDLRMSIAEDYDQLYKSVKRIMEELPF